MCNYTIVTGLCGSGKTTLINNLNVESISFDHIYSYKNKLINWNTVNKKLAANTKNLYLDAFNTELIEYIKSRDDNATFRIIFLYTDLDDYYNTIAIEEPRNFMPGNKYDDYIKLFKSEIFKIQNNIKNLNADSIVYKYRKGNSYTDFETSKHLEQLLETNKSGRLIKYIKEVSGHSTYQSIVLDGEYIQKGSEKDWITLNNILKCTDLTDKVVMDTGCFNGYFSFKSLEKGAKRVIGVDHNSPAISICNKLCIYNNLHRWRLGKKDEYSSPIEFKLRKIGKEDIFSDIEVDIDIIYALNYLHHLERELGLNTFLAVIDSFFKNSKEIIFEVNEREIQYINNVANKNSFKLANKIESHRKTSVGDRWVLHYTL